MKHGKAFLVACGVAILVRLALAAACYFILKAWQPHPFVAWERILDVLSFAAMLLTGFAVYMELSDSWGPLGE